MGSLTVSAESSRESITKTVAVWNLPGTIRESATSRSLGGWVGE